MVILERVTTEFCPDEDRIRIAGRSVDGGQVVIWMTRRLLGVLLPVLFKHLDSQFVAVPPEHRDTLQEFAQQAASDALGGNEPVQATHEDDVMLASAVDINHFDGGVVLTFRNAPEGGCRIQLAGELLRQWLHILYQIDQKANWQLRQWPSWLTGAGAHESGHLVALH